MDPGSARRVSWTKSRWWCVLGAALVMLAAPSLAAGPAADEESRPSDTEAAERPGLAERVDAKRFRPSPLPYDRPDAAALHAQSKRQPIDPEGLPLSERLRRAEARKEAMTHFSSRRGRPLATAVGPRSFPAGDKEAQALGTWTPLGPGNIGGRTRSLLIHPDRPNTLWTGGVSGGLWKTTNGGSRWVPLGDMAANLAIASMAMDPANPDVIYAGTGEGVLREVVRGTGLPLRGGGIFKSTNGTNFFRLASTNNPNFHWVNDLEVSHLDSRRIYAATRTGVWRSSNGGDSWQRILATTVTGGCFDLALRSDRTTDVLFVTCGSFEQATIYRNETAEGSAAFQAVHTEPGMGRTSLAIAPSNQDVIYAMAASIQSGGLHGFFRSDSGGDPSTWAVQVRANDPNRLDTLLLSNPLIANLVECGFGGTNGSSTLGWYSNMIAVDPTDPMVVWAGGVDLFRSDNGGADWGVISYWWDSPPSAHADQHIIRFHPGYDGASNQTLFLGNDGGVWRTDNARAAKATGTFATCNSANTNVRWRSLNRNLGITQFYHGAPFPDGRRFFGGTQDNGTLLGTLGDGIDGWREILGGDGGYVAVDPQATNILYAETQWLGLRKSVDGGASFQLKTAGITEGQDDVLFITPYLLDPNRSQRLWTGGRRLWRSNDRAESWQAASGNLSGGRVSAIAVAPGNSDTVLAGTDTGFIHRSTNATSSGAGSGWPSARPRSGFVSWIAFDPSRPLVVYTTYAGFGGTHVWKSIDGGVSWSPRDGSGSGRLPDIPVHAVLVHPDDGDRLFLATDLGVFTSIDGGENWMAENTGFANAVTESLALVRPNPAGEPVLFAFTHGRGAWRVELAAIDDGGGSGGGGGGGGGGPVEPSVCEPSPTTVCLGTDGRFQVEVEWTDFAGEQGVGTLVDGGQSPDSALFWFFDAPNWEMLLKVVDGCDFNDHFWVFAAAVTNVETTLTVTDTVAGWQQVYENPLGVSSPAITDTEAFDTCP